MSSGDDNKNIQARIDGVFVKAVEFGVLLRGNSLDSQWEYDLSGMTLPVARAACRFILKQLANSKPGPIQDLRFITGTGSRHQNAPAAERTSLRDYVQDVLLRDLCLSSSVDERAKGTVVVASTTLTKWIGP